MLQLYPPPLSAARVAPPMPPPPTPPPMPSSASPPGQARWDIFPADPALPVELSEDAVREVLSHVTQIAVLRQQKLVCKPWQQQGRAVLTDVDWQLRNGVTLHSLISKHTFGLNLPSSQLVSKLAKARPELLNGRDHEGLLPLQYAAASQEGRSQEGRGAREHAPDPHQGRRAGPALHGQGRLLQQEGRAAQRLYARRPHATDG